MNYIYRNILKITVIPCLFGVLPPAHGKSFCDKIKSQIPEPKVNFISNKGTPSYSQISRAELIKKAKNSRARGLTEANFKMVYEIETAMFTNGEVGCVYLEKINITYGYPTLNIYIEDKYPKGSCEYREILKHENQHVKIHQDALKKYTPKISRAAYQVVNRIKPVNLSDLSKSSEATDKIVDQIKNDLLVDKLTKQLIQTQITGNKALDQKENYQSIQKRCDNW